MTEPTSFATGGATVTLTAPSDQLTAAREIVVNDGQGRGFTLRKPGVLAQFELIEALGDTARNEVYMAMVLPLLFVAAIDGAPVVRPGSKAELNALIQRLDEDGIQAVMSGVMANFGSATEEAAKNG